MFNKQLREDLEELKKHVFVGYAPGASFLDIYVGRAKRLRLREVFSALESRLDQQEKMQKMLFAHLGIEYAKTTEETATGRQEKEVLRKIKKTIKK
jgi:hypothetical protein